MTDKFGGLEEVTQAVEAWADKTKLYQFYNLISSAHCFKTKNSPLCVEKLGAIKFKSDNPILTINWKKGRKKHSIVFTESSLLNARLSNNKIILPDKDEKEQELYLFNLKNALEDTQKQKISRSFMDPMGGYF